MKHYYTIRGRKNIDVEILWEGLAEATILGIALVFWPIFQVVLIVSLIYNLYF